MKKTVFLAMVAVFLLLSVCIFNNKAHSQEVVLQECYGGAEYTEMGYRDEVTGEVIGVRVRCLPWWWERSYLPLGWFFLTPDYAPIAFYDVGYYGGDYTFSSVRIVDDRFRGHLDRFRGLRGPLHDRFSSRFHEGRNHAMQKYPGLKRPENFRQPGHQGSGQVGARLPGHKGPGSDIRGPKTVGNAGPQHITPSAPNAVRGPRITGSSPAPMPNALRGPRSPSTTQGIVGHQPGTGNVGPPNVRGPGPQGQVRGPQASPMSKQPVMRGPAAYPRPSAPRPAPAAKSPAPAAKKPNR